MTGKDLKDRFFGRSATATIIQLVVACIVVGAVLSFLGIGPREFWSWLIDTVRGLIDMLGDSLGEVLGRLVAYLLIGAAIVVPIWLVSRLFARGDKSPPK